MSVPVDYVGGQKIYANEVEENEAFLEAIAPPVGAILPFAGAGDPPSPNSIAAAKWLLADGRAISRAAYPDLFAAIGTTYGAGNGTTTFNLPDLRARAPFGADDFGTAKGAAARRDRNATPGGAGGEEEHALSVSEMPSHTHPGSTLTRSTDGFGSGTWGNFGVSNGSSATFPLSVAAQGGDAAHENMPPFVTTNYIVRVL